MKYNSGSSGRKVYTTELVGRKEGFTVEKGSHKGWLEVYQTNSVPMVISQFGKTF